MAAALPVRLVGAVLADHGRQGAQIPALALAGVFTVDPTALNFRDLRLLSGDLTGR